MKPNEALAHIRLLCCMDLDGPAIMAQVLRVLHDWVPSETNNLFIASPSGQDVASIIVEHPLPDDLCELYINVFHGNRELAVGPTFTEAMKMPGMIETSRIFGRDFLDSELYNQFFRPMTADEVLRVVIADGEGSLASLGLWRTGKGTSLLRDEALRLKQIIPYMAHALRKSSIDSSPLSDVGETGLMILDMAGKIHYVSARARELLALCLGGDGLYFMRGGADASPVARIAKAIGDVVAGRQSRAPFEVVRTAWGTFHFRGSILQDTGAVPSMVAVTIDYLQPTQLRLMERMRELPVSSRQKELCLLLAEGLSNSEIANRMGVTAHTATSYLRALYDKLGVASKKELLQYLM